MISNYTPPQYTKVKHFLSQLRAFYFEDWDKLPLLLEQSEKKELIKEGTLLNLDYLDKQKKEKLEYDQKKAQGVFPLFLNLTQPRYQNRDAAIYTFCELDVEDEAQLISFLKKPDNKNLQIPLKEILVTITSPESFDDSSEVSISYDKTLKVAKSIDEFRDWLKFYLIDRKIKEQVRNMLSYNPDPYSSSQGFDKYLESWVFFDQKRIGMNYDIWVNDRFWYRCLSDDRITISGFSTHRETMDQRFDVKDQLLFLEKYKTNRHVNLLTDMRLEKVSPWQKHEVSCSPEKELLDFAKECFDAAPKSHPKDVPSDSLQTADVEVVEIQKPPLIEAMQNLLQEYSSHDIKLYPQERLYFYSKVSIGLENISGRTKPDVAAHVKAIAIEKKEEFNIMIQQKIKQSLEADPTLDNKIVIQEDFLSIATLLRPVIEKKGSYKKPKKK